MQKHERPEPCCDEVDEQPLVAGAFFPIEDGLIQRNVESIIDHPEEAVALAYSLGAMVKQRNRLSDELLTEAQSILAEIEKCPSLESSPGNHLMLVPSILLKRIQQLAWPS